MIAATNLKCHASVQSLIYSTSFLAAIRDCVATFQSWISFPLHSYRNDWNRDVPEVISKARASPAQA